MLRGCCSGPLRRVCARSPRPCSACSAAQRSGLARTLAPNTAILPCGRGPKEATPSRGPASAVQRRPGSRFPRRIAADPASPPCGRGPKEEMPSRGPASAVQSIPERRFLTSLSADQASLPCGRGPKGATPSRGPASRPPTPLPAPRCPSSPNPTPPLPRTRALSLARSQPPLHPWMTPSRAGSSSPARGARLLRSSPPKARDFSRIHDQRHPPQIKCCTYCKENGHLAMDCRGTGIKASSRQISGCNPTREGCNRNDKHVNEEKYNLDMLFADEEEDAETKAHRSYHVKVCKKGHILCLACHLSGKEVLVEDNADMMKVHWDNKHGPHHHWCQNSEEWLFGCS